MQDEQQSESVDEADGYMALTADLVSAYVANNPIPHNEVADLIYNVSVTLSSLATDVSAASSSKAKVAKPTPAQIKNSITPDALISFENGKPYKTLRLHLRVRGLSPEAYRQKWGLPPDCPMTSSCHSAMRSEVARALRLKDRLKELRKGARKSPHR